MKKILYSLATALFALSFSACNDNDTEGVYYYAANTEAVFTAKSGSYFFKGDDPAEYTVTLMRSNANGAAAVPVTVTDESGVFNVPSTANFADGSYETTLTVTFDKDGFEIGTPYALGLQLPAHPISGKQTSYTLNVTRDYTWEVFAEGTLTSVLFGDEWGLTIERAVEEPNYYKLKDIYEVGYDIKIMVAEDGSISMKQELDSYGYYDIETGLVISGYGEFYTYLDPDPTYSKFDAENQYLILSQYFYTATDEFGWFDDVISW